MGQTGTIQCNRRRSFKSKLPKITSEGNLCSKMVPLVRIDAWKCGAATMNLTWLSPHTPHEVSANPSPPHTGRLRPCSLGRPVGQALLGLRRKPVLKEHAFKSCCGGPKSSQVDVCFSNTVNTPAKLLQENRGEASTLGCAFSLLAEPATPPIHLNAKPQDN